MFLSSHIDSRPSRLINGPALLLASGLSIAASADPAGVDLATVSRFDAASGSLSVCIGLYDDDDVLVRLDDGRAETYLVELSLRPELAADDSAEFAVLGAALTERAACSGRLQGETLSDSILIDNGPPDLDGRIFEISFSLSLNPEPLLRYHPERNSLSELRDLNSNSVALGADLGSFASTLNRQFNTVNRPAALSLTAPSCQDPNGDATQAVIELDGGILQRLEPGASFSLDAREFGTGSYSLRAYCSDESDLAAAGQGDFAASSAYAAGATLIEVISDPACQRPAADYLEHLNENFPDNLPSWEDLACFYGGLSRQPDPDFFVQLSDTPPEEVSPEQAPAFWSVVQDALAFDQGWPEANISSAILGEVPPYLIGIDDFYDATEWDQKLRGMALYGIYLKQLGYRITGAFFYPPSSANNLGRGVLPAMDTVDDFLAWWDDTYIPERVSLARMAELIHAEYLQPWDLEPGQFMRAFGDAWLDSLSDEEELALAQQIIDSLYAALRPEFSGTLAIINYDRYGAHGEHWQRLDLTAWDQVRFSLFTEGDVEATEYYLAEQLAGYQTMIARDNLSNWILQEITVNPDSHDILLRQMDPPVQFSDIETDVYRSLFDAIEALAIPPRGIGITAGNITEAATVTLLRERLAQLRGD